MLPPLLIALTAILAAVHAFVAWHVARSVRQLTILADIPLDATAPPPRLSLITPARDEATVIEASLRSALATDDPHIEVVAINDRSTDDTGAILDRLAAEDPRVVAVHVDTLPDGWLGKLNALHHGVARATGDWLLFADADTRYAPGALRRAVAHAERGGFDLVTVYPEITSRDPLAGTVFAAAPVLGHLGMPMHRVSDPDHPAYAGMGAFILVRRATFERSAGLEWLRLEVADDMGLGLLIQNAGGRLDVVNGRGQVFLPFYETFGEMVARMQKNWWAIVARFSLLRAVALSAVLCIVALTPLLAFVPGVPLPARILAVVGAALHSGASVHFNRWVHRPVGSALLPQVGLLLCAAQLLRAAWIGRRIGGIEWRGRLYRADELEPMQRVRV